MVQGGACFVAKHRTRARLEPGRTFRGREQALACNTSGQDPAQRGRSLEESNARQTKTSHISTSEGLEDYLTHPDVRARETTRLRGGTNELRIEKGRHRATNRDHILHESERVCLICASGEVEDERHFLIDCAEYEDLRETMFDVVDEKMKENCAKEVRKEEQGNKG